MFTLFGLAILAALFAVFQDGSGDPAAVSSPADAGSGSPAGGDVSGVSPGQAAPTDPASGGVTPAGEFADLEQALGDDPRKGAFLTRLNELSSQRRQAQEQLSQFTEVEAFLPLVRELRQAGYTPDQISQVLTQPSPQIQQPQAAPDPQEQFHAALAQRGVDPYSLDPQTYALAQMNWENAQQIRGFQEFQQAQQVQAVEAELSSEMTQAVTKFPALQAFQTSIYGHWGTLAEAAMAQGRPVPSLMQVAEQFHKELDAYRQGELARYAAAKQQDAAVPVAAGGSAPAPTEDLAKNFHNLPPAEQNRLLESYMAAQRGGG